MCLPEDEPSSRGPAAVSHPWGSAPAESPYLGHRAQQSTIYTWASQCQVSPSEEPKGLALTPRV